jgi:DNA invertase Pin-like site-specific DNA recombinase
MNKIFGYARVSTVDQNLDTQIEALEKYGCTKVFQDKISGLAIQRPALDEMITMLREGDTVVVARFFRLGRSRDHVISLVNSLVTVKEIATFSHLSRRIFFAEYSIEYSILRPLVLVS